jgi:hypothetical protein
MWSPCFLISSEERDEYDHPALRPFATIARSYIAIKNQKQNAGLLCGNWRTIEMIGFTVNDRELFFAQKLGTSPPLNMRSATACALKIELHLMVDSFWNARASFQSICDSRPSTIAPMSGSARSGDSTPRALRSALLSSLSRPLES